MNIAAMKTHGVPSALLALSFFTSGFLDTGELPVVGEKLAIPDVFLTLLIAFTLLAGIRRPWLLRIDSSILPLVLAALLFVYHGTVSMLVNGMLFPDRALPGAITIVNYWYGFLMFLCVVLLLDSWERLTRALIAWLAGAAVVALFGTWGVIGGAPDFVYDHFRISSTLRGVNQMQSYLAPALYGFMIFLFFGHLQPWTRALLAGCVAISLISLLSTGSRASIAIILICFAFVGWQLLRRAWRSPGLLIVAAASVAAMVATVLPYVAMVWTWGLEVVPEGPLRGLARPIVKFREMADMIHSIDALGPRAQQIKLVAAHWFERPVLGTGPGTFQTAFDHKYEVHNSYLGVLVEHGAVGLVLYLGFTVGILAYTTWYARRRSRGKLVMTVLAGSVALVLLYGMTSFGVRQRIFWLTLGAATAAVQIYRREERENAEAPAHSGRPVRRAPPLRPRLPGMPSHRAP